MSVKIKENLENRGHGQKINLSHSLPTALVKILPRSRRDLGEIDEISPRSHRSRRDLGETAAISPRFENIAPRYLARGEIASRSRRGKPVLDEIAAISPRQTRSCRDNHHLGEI